MSPERVLAAISSNHRRSDENLKKLEITRISFADSQFFITFAADCCEKQTSASTRQT